MPSLHALLATAMRLKTEYRFRMNAMLFYKLLPNKHSVSRLRILITANKRARLLEEVLNQFHLHYHPRSPLPFSKFVLSSLLLPVFQVTVLQEVDPPRSYKYFTAIFIVCSYYISSIFKFSSVVLLVCIQAVLDLTNSFPITATALDKTACPLTFFPPLL